MKPPAELAQIALEVASEAAELLRAGWRTQFEIKKKGRTDLVTEFDLKSEQLIRSRLQARTPDIEILAEEGGGEPPGDAPIWCCDPLDGTTNFAHGHPFFAVSIGLLVNREPVAGAVVAPALHTTWAGSRESGTSRSGSDCRVSETAELSEALLATGFPYRGRDVAPSNNFDSFVAVKRKCRAVRRCGSAALDLCLVADGTYDAYWERGLNAWDLAAGAALVVSAGGTITDLRGGPADVRTGDVIASNGKVHDQLRSLLVV